MALFQITEMKTRSQQREDIEKRDTQLSHMLIAE